MPRFFYDTEFLDDGSQIHLISIGIVAEDGREYYAVNSDMPVQEIKAHHWLATNVWPHLPLVVNNDILESFRYSPEYSTLDRTSLLLRPHWMIANEVREFILNPTTGIVLPPDQEPVEHELWAYYGAYDHVALAQLWGPMIKLPKGIPMWTHDLMQLWEAAGRPDKPEEPENQHNALADARWNRDLYWACKRAIQAD